jgi:hypothetical protein
MLKTNRTEERASFGTPFSKPFGTPFNNGSCSCSGSFVSVLIPVRCSNTILCISPRKTSKLVSTIFAPYATLIRWVPSNLNSQKAKPVQHRQSHLSLMSEASEGEPGPLLQSITATDRRLHPSLSIRAGFLSIYPVHYMQLIMLHNNIHDKYQKIYRARPGFEPGPSALYYSDTTSTADERMYEASIMSVRWPVNTA